MRSYHFALENSIGTISITQQEREPGHVLFFKSD